MYEENDVLAQVLERAREDFGRTQRPFQRRPNGVSWTLGKFGKHSSHSPEQVEAAKRLRVLDKSSLFVYSHSCSRGASTAGAQDPCEEADGPHTEE
jgi:hypothetical protein